MRLRVDRAVVAGLGVVVLWASAFPAIQAAVPEMGVVGLSIVRLGVASVVLLTFGAIRRIRLPRRRDLGWILAAGFFGMAAYQLTLNASEQHVPAGTVSIIVAAAPLVSVVVARALFSERIGPATVVGSVIAITGVLVVCVARAAVDISATIWIAVAAMVVQGIYHPLQRPVLTSRTGLEVATYAITAGTVMTLPLLPLALPDLLHASAAGWASAVYLGILPSAVGYVLWGTAVARLPVAVSTSLLYLVPPVAVLIAWIWLDELPLPVELAGGAIVILGVVTIARGSAVLQLLRGRFGPPGPSPRTDTDGSPTVE